MEKFYRLKITPACLTKLGLQKRSGLNWIASQETKSIKKISAEREISVDEQSSHGESLQELFNVFHSISKIKKNYKAIV